MHTTSGFAGLAAALVIGQPSSSGPKNHAHSVPLVFIGTSLLWFGWFVFFSSFLLHPAFGFKFQLKWNYYLPNNFRNGFNGGSALNTADGIAALATVSYTHRLSHRCSTRFLVTKGTLSLSHTRTQRRNYQPRTHFNLTLGEH